MICRSIVLDPRCAQLVTDVAGMKCGSFVCTEDEIEQIGSVMCHNSVEGGQEEEPLCEGMVRKRVAEMVRMNSAFLLPPILPEKCTVHSASHFGSVDFARSYVFWSLPTQEFQGSLSQKHLTGHGNKVRLQATASLDFVVPPHCLHTGGHRYALIRPHRQEYVYATDFIFQQVRTWAHCLCTHAHTCVRTGAHPHAPTRTREPAHTSTLSRPPQLSMHPLCS